MSLLSRRGRVGGYRIRAVLAVIAVVPLVGAGWFATNEVGRAREERARAEEVNSSVERLVALSELRTRLLDERNWSSAAVGLEQIGLTPDLALALTGIDVPAQAAEAAGLVDELIEAEGLDAASVTLSDIRSHTELSLTEAGARYLELEADIGRQADELFDTILAVASEVQDRGGLTRGLRVLEASTIARQAVSSEFNHYFGAQFSDLGNRSDELTALVGQDWLRRAALAELDRLAAPDSRTRLAIDAIAASGDATEFDQAVAALVAENMTGSGKEAALTAVLADVSGVASTFEDSSAATGLYFELVDAAGEDMNAAGRAASAAAQGRYRRALAGLTGLIALSLLVAVAAARAIARPIRRLAAAANKLSYNESAPELIIESGPVEVREAAQAINDATTHLELAARQALALAEGDLEHESLREPSSGSLGASLQNAVRTLAQSLQEREEFRHRMAHEATHDGLTQLPNRNASLGQLKKGLARTTRGGGCLAVLFIDLDGFKDINDHHGHQSGDTVLRVTAQRLASAIRDSDHVGRLGGDEFLVIAEPVADQAEAVALAQVIHQALVEPVQMDNTAVTIGASIGIAISEDGSTSASDLLRDADLAVYQAKESGRDRIEVCSDELRAAMLERADLEQAIRTAIIDTQFVLHYQPIVEPRTADVIGYEALIRWQRPGHGIVAPDDFIPFAERSDLIVAIDRWVIRNVAHQIVTWEAMTRTPVVPISINVSGRSLASSDFVANVTDPLDQYGIDASQIIIEVTESALLEDLTTAAIKLQQLRNRGIRIAIDDFGTGYTSLAHLKSLPIDILKIDRSFTNDESAASLVQLIIDTGHLLGATVTAEGIETQRQAALLGQMGSDDLQGYLYGRPKPADDLDPRNRRTGGHPREPQRSHH